MYGTSRSPQQAYQNAAVATASPARLLVMLVERLVLDVERALEAQQRADHDAARGHLLHAQEIVHELAASLRTDGWPAARQLLALYEFLRGKLVEANVRRDVVATTEALGLARDLCDTWRTAALQAASA